MPNGFLLSLLAVAALSGVTQAQNLPPSPTAGTSAPQVLQSAEEKKLTEISRQKWLWMAERNVTALDGFVHEKALFVHMGATMSKSQELDVIKSGRIEYKQADIQEISARVIGDTAIVLSSIQLFALVGGNEARNPFTVTETYIKQGNEWKLAALAFTRRMTPP